MKRFDLPKNMNRTLEDFVKRLKDIYDKGLVSVVLYGSVASGEYSDKHSNVNVAVILEDASLPNIARASGVVNRYRFRRIYPAFFTETYITNSADVFPVEFLDMKENHLILYGKDIMKNLKVEPKNLRFQCEQELKSKLINIKMAYLAHRSAFDRKKLLFRFFTSSLHILRNILRLKNDRVPPYSKDDVVQEAAREFGVDALVFQRIMDAKKKNLQIRKEEIEDLFFNFVAELEKIAEALDKI